MHRPPPNSIHGLREGHAGEFRGFIARPRRGRLRSGGSVRPRVSGSVAPVGIFKCHFAFRLGPHPYRCRAHQIRLKRGKTCQWTCGSEIAETFVIELERRCSKRDRAADRHRLVEKSARFRGRQQMNLVDVAPCEHHAVATIELRVTQDYERVRQFDYEIREGARAASLDERADSALPRRGSAACSLPSSVGTSAASGSTCTSFTAACLSTSPTVCSLYSRP